MGADLACPRVTARIDLNHLESRHLLEVPTEDLRTGLEKIYSIQSMGDHDHALTLTADHFAALNRAEEVRVMAMESDHGHLVRIRCAPGGGSGRGR